MERNFIVTNMLCRIAIVFIIGLFCFSSQGCLVIGAKNGDGDVIDRVAVIESRLDNLERVYASSSPQPPQQQTLQAQHHYEQTDGFATTTQVAETRAGSRIAPK